MGICIAMLRLVDFNSECGWEKPSTLGGDEMLVLVDTAKSVCVVGNIRVPNGRMFATVSFVIGKVIVACQDGVQCGEDVAIAGSAVDYIREHGQDKLYAAILSQNQRRQTDDDPYWFASRIRVNEDPVAGV